jgi:hypothetical protein
LQNRFLKKRIESGLKAVGNIIAFFPSCQYHQFQKQQYSKVTTLANIRILMDPHAIDDDNHGVTSILTPNEIMKMGLKLVGFNRRRILRVWSRKTNVDRFKGFFGASPSVYAEIWEDPQKTDVFEARVPVQDRNPKCFLMAMHHLKRHPTELEREAMFDISRMWGRDWCWYFH